MAHEVTVYASFDLRNIDDPESLYFNSPKSDISILNQITPSQSILINDDNPNYNLAISVNGVDGIGYNSDKFNLDKIYYKNQQVYFTTRLKTPSLFPAKNKPTLLLKNTLEQECDMRPELIDSLGNVVSASFYSNFGELSTQKDGGFFKGYFIPHEVKDNVQLIVRSLINGNTLVGTSNLFNVYPVSGKNNFRKVNEDHDQKAQFNEFLYQPNLINNDYFFNNILGQIVGDKDEDPNNLGIKVYEKISNFVANTVDVETCNIKQLISQLKLIDNEVLTYSDKYPGSLQRIIDFFSIKISKLKEQKNNFNFNFDNKGNINSTKNGINLGDELPLNIILSGGDLFSPLVAYNKFTEKYKLLNVDPTSSFDFRFENSNNNTYFLSSWTENWPWRLSFPNVIGKNQFFEIEDRTKSFEVKGSVALDEDGIEIQYKSVSGTYDGSYNFVVGGTDGSKVVGKDLIITAQANDTFKRINDNDTLFRGSQVLSGGDGTFRWAFDPQIITTNAPVLSYFQIYHSRAQAISVNPFELDWSLLDDNNSITDKKVFKNASFTEKITNNFILLENNQRLLNEISNYQASDLVRYYTFYNYVSTINGSDVNSILDISNSNTNLPLSSLTQLESNGGMIDDIILNNFYTKTSLVSS